MQETDDEHEDTNGPMNEIEYENGGELIEDDEVLEEKQQPCSTSGDQPFAHLFLVKNNHSSETYVCGFSDPIERGIQVVSPTRYGIDLGTVLGELSCGGCSANGSINAIVRIATEADLEKYRQNCQREADAFEICNDKIAKHGLEMQLVSAHYLLEETKVLFFFTADSRVDFRNLVKDLVAVFRMRIELRQIGVRDEARVVGGIAVCGRELCCNSITDRLNPVSIKMAKEQNLSLNSMKISGPCGRLLCCLSYEYDFYRDEKKQWPSEGSRIAFNGEMCKISEVNILSKKIYLQVPDGRVTAVPFMYLKRQEDQKRWEIDPLFFEET